MRQTALAGELVRGKLRQVAMGGYAFGTRIAGMHFSRAMMKNVTHPRLVDNYGIL